MSTEQQDLPEEVTANNEIKQERTRTRYRVSEDPNYGSKRPRDEIVEAIDFHATNALTVNQVEVEGKPVFLAYTRPTRHQYAGGEPMLIDALVTGDSLKAVEKYLKS